MTRMSIDCRLAYDVKTRSDFIFHLLAMRLPSQKVVREDLSLSQGGDPRYFDDPVSGNRFFRYVGQPGPLEVRYRATVELDPPSVDSAAPEIAIADLPGEVLHYLNPTRYCESDLLGRAAARLFGDIRRGHFRVEAVARWVRENVEYRIGSSNSTTTATNVFVSRAGVCRDFAHLAITFCRALGIPARFVSGYVQFGEPPPDFHAIFDVYIGDRWVAFDPTGLAPTSRMVRIGTGRDAKDVAFATIFGEVEGASVEPLITEDDGSSPLCKADIRGAGVGGD